MSRKVVEIAATSRERGTAAADSLAADRWVKGSPTDSDTVRLTIDIDRALHRRVRIHCAESGEKMADVVRAMLGERFPE